MVRVATSLEQLLTTYKEKASQSGLLLTSFQAFG